MSGPVFITQLLNGLQFGVLLFLMSAGLTLVLGIMNFVNLMHGSLYMVGAYIAAGVFNSTGSLAVAVPAAIGGALLVGFAAERLVLARLYERDHLDQVLATFGLILLFNEIVRMIWGPAALSLDVPEHLSGPVHIFGLPYPSYRFAIIAVGLIVAIGLYVLIHRSRLGIMIRASASNRAMTGMLGINVKVLNVVVICLGAALAGLAGLMAAPISAVQPGMGEPILILTLVVIVVGGIGSVRGAFYGALIIGVIDTIGRTFLPLLLREFMDRALAQAMAAGLGSILIYSVMVAVLALRPRGLFPVRHG